MSTIRHGQAAVDQRLEALREAVRRNAGPFEHRVMARVRCADEWTAAGLIRLGYPGTASEPSCSEEVRLPTLPELLPLVEKMHSNYWLHLFPVAMWIGSPAQDTAGQKSAVREYQHALRLGSYSGDEREHVAHLLDALDLWDGTYERYDDRLSELAGNVVASLYKGAGGDNGREHRRFLRAVSLAALMQNGFPPQDERERLARWWARVDRIPDTAPASGADAPRTPHVPLDLGDASS